MRKDFGARALTYPQPVYMIGSFDKDDHPDLMNAAWGGISDTMEISLSLSSGHKTVQNILKTQAYTPSSKVHAPIINELPICLECRLKDYDLDTEIMKGEIVNVSVDERVLDETGRVDVSKVKPITFDPFNNQYVGLGKVVGRAFKDGLKLK